MIEEGQPTNQPKPFQALLLFLGMLVLVAIGIYHTYPPQPGSLNALPDAFSSAHAMEHVWEIGVKPHPTGSYENEQVRTYIVRQLKELGFEPEIQSVQVASPGNKYAGLIHNIIVRIPGKKRGMALMLAAHYDSVPTGPGAADDSASIAGILETLRVLKTSFPLQNEVICLFSDGEEAGLLGAEAFVKYHPLAKSIGVALNFEYRGNRGAFMMFETSQNNGKLIEGLAKAVPFVLANSLMYEVYKRLPNDTDFSIFKRAGIPGLNFAAIDGYESYHNARDRPEKLNQGTLQHEGDIMLALTKYFGTVALDNLQAEDHVYFDLPGFGLIHYPEHWLIPMNGLLLLLFCVVAVQGAKRKKLKVSHVLWVAILFPIIAFVLALVSHYLCLGIQYLCPVFWRSNQGDDSSSHWPLIAFVLIYIGFFSACQLWVSRWLPAADISFGIMLFWLVLNLICGIGLPGASFMFFWPLISVLISVGINLFLGKCNCFPLALITLFLGGMPGIFIFTPLIICIYIALTPSMIAIDIFCLVLLLGLLAPLLDAVGFRKSLIAATLVSGFSVLVVGSMASGFGG